MLTAGVKPVDMANPFVHVELASTDVAMAMPDGAMPDMAYTLIKVGEGTGGGMMQHPMPDPMPGAPSA